MTIEVLTPAPDTKLTTLAKVKTLLGIASDDVSHDETLTDMIQAASDFAVRFTNRIFAKQTVKESLVGKGRPDLMVSITPILTLTKVEYDEAEADDVVILDHDAGFIQRRAGFRSTEFLSNDFDAAPSSYGEKRWHVTYTGGYVLPGWAADPHGARTLPYDLERAIMDMVKVSFKNIALDGSMKSYKIGDTSITWDRSLAEGNLGGLVPPNALAVLRYYQRIK